MVSNMVIRHSHLASANTRTYIRHPVIVPYLLVLIIRVCFTSLGSIEHYFLLSSSIGTNQRTAPRSSNHLVPIERKYSIFPESTTHTTIKPRPEPLRRALHHRNIVPPPYLTNLLYLPRHSIKAHRHYCLRLHPPTGNTILYPLFEQFRVHIPAFSLRIHKNGGSPQIINRISRSTECETLHHHLIPGTHPAREQRQMHRRRPRRKCHHLLILPHERFQILLKPIHIRPQRHHPIRIKRLLYIFLLNTRIDR